MFSVVKTFYLMLLISFGKKGLSGFVKIKVAICITAKAKLVVYQLFKPK